MGQQRITALRDVLAHGLRELAIRVAQVDLSEDDEPTEDEVRAFIAAVSSEATKAAASGVVVPEHVAVFADARLIAAALDPMRAGCRVQFAEDKTVLLAPPPPGYKLGSIAHEIDKAAQEATPTEPPAKCFHCMGSGRDEYGPCPQCQTEPPKRPDSSLYELNDAKAPSGDPVCPFVGCEYPHETEQDHMDDLSTMQCIAAGR